jgi:hypothetical protein
MQSLITVYAEKPEIDYGVASEELLRAVLVEYQNKNINDVALENQLKNRQQNQSSNDEVVENSETYSLVVETRIDDNSTSVIETVIKPQNQQANIILDWRYGQKNKSLFDDKFINQVVRVENEFTYNN